MSSRYTLKDLRKVNRLSIEQLSEKTGVDVETLTALEIDSSDISFEVMKKLSRFYCIAANYIFLGEQSEFEAEQLDKVIQHVALSKRISGLEIVELEKRLGLSELSLFQAILELSKEWRQ